MRLKPLVTVAKPAYAGHLLAFRSELLSRSAPALRPTRFQTIPHNNPVPFTPTGEGNAFTETNSSVSESSRGMLCEPSLRAGSFRRIRYASSPIAVSYETAHNASSRYGDVRRRLRLRLNEPVRARSFNPLYGGACSANRRFAPVRLGESAARLRPSRFQSNPHNNPVPFTPTGEAERFT